MRRLNHEEIDFVRPGLIRIQFIIITITYNIAYLLFSLFSDLTQTRLHFFLSIYSEKIMLFG